MRANSPAALFLSLVLHTGLAALLFLATYLASRQVSAPPVIFELVAGAPTAPGELTAPTKGTSSVKLKIPRPKVEKVEPAPREEPSPAETQSKMSYEEYVRKHGAPKPADTKPRPAAPPPRIQTEGIKDGVTGGSTANNRGGGGGRALTREEADAMTVYEALVRNLLKEAHEKPVGVSDNLSAEVEFFVAASGEISNVRLSRSSGNAEFDQSVLAAFKRITWPGARPDKKSDLWRLTFRMREEQ
jgi:colicin import membrane protein